MTRSIGRPSPYHAHRDPAGDWPSEPYEQSGEPERPTFKPLGMVIALMLVIGALLIWLRWMLGI